MKKVILVIFGIVFTIVTGCGLLISMISGIPTLEQPAATFYLVKAIVLAFGFPILAFGFFAHNLWLRDKLEKRDQLFRNILEELKGAHQSSCSDSGSDASRNLKDSLTCLLCAFAEDSTLSEKDQKDLLDFIDKFK